VFHEEAVAPVAQKNIPIHIRNTNEPEHPGTVIAGMAQPTPTEAVAESGKHAPALRTTGVAGRTGFRSVLVERPMLSKDVTYVDRVRAAFADAEVPVRHAVSGSDSLLLVCPAGQVQEHEAALKRTLTKELGAEQVHVGGPLAVVGVVYPARGIHAGVLSRIFTAFEEARVELCYVSVGESPHTAVFGVDEDDYERAVRAVYQGARA
jgi:aspartate kinase